MELTLEGQDLLPAIRELLYWAGQIQERSASLQGLEQGELAIGSYYSIASLLAACHLADFQRISPIFGSMCRKLKRTGPCCRDSGNGN